MKKSFVLTADGESLLVEQVRRFVNDPHSRVVVAPRAMRRVKESHQFLSEAAEKTVIYGVNTGFGPMASFVISKDSLKILQRNLVRSHATGIGFPIRQDFVLAAMLIRLNTLLKGNSGVSPELIETLVALINRRIIPIVPEHGAVGTSGDLIQLAHIASVIIGEGECVFSGKRGSAKEALRKARITPHQLHPKEGLALINGTSVMTGITAALLSEIENLLNAEVRQSAAALDIIGGYDDSIDKTLHLARPHPGQMSIAHELRHLLADSRSLTSRDKIANTTEITSTTYELPEMIQNVYSFRCVPQILGPLADTLMTVRRVVEIEMNSTTDNPVVAYRQRRFLHGGNFHGDYIATAVDQLKIPLVKLSILSERRINYFLDESVNKRFPPFLNKKTPGLTLALQGLQFVATSTTANNQSLAFPHSVHSISTNASNQDVVSMGTDAALLLERVVNNTAYVLAIEGIVLAQAYEFLPKKSRHLLAHSTRALYSLVRKSSPLVDDDRSLSKDIDRLATIYRNSNK